MKILKIGALWCPECLIMKPRWEAIKKEFPDLNIEEIDCDQHPAVKKKYDIDHVPTAIFLDQEKELGRFKGLWETKEMIGEIEKYLRLC